MVARRGRGRRHRDPEVLQRAGRPSGGAGAGQRRMRTSMRQVAAGLFAINIPPSKLGFMLAFQPRPGTGGREGLKPASAWFEVAKLQALAAKQVARELSIAHIWSWGWGVFNEAGSDPDKQGAACVWPGRATRALCNAPRHVAEFDADRREGQIDLPGGVRCALGDHRATANQIGELRLTRDPEVAVGALRPPRRERRGVRRPARHPRGRADDRRAPLPRQHGRVSRGPAAGGAAVLWHAASSATSCGVVRSRQADSSLAVHGGARRAASRRTAQSGLARFRSTRRRRGCRTAGASRSVWMRRSRSSRALGRAVKVRAFEASSRSARLRTRRRWPRFPSRRRARRSGGRYGRPHRPIATTAGRRSSRSAPSTTYAAPATGCRRSAASSSRATCRF